jgi:tetraacyldisaccharide 4'-kinase
MKFTQVPQFCYKWQLVTILLLPFTAIFCLIMLLRRWFYAIIPKTNFNLPIIIVGNISLGGTGKTPLVIWLASFLRQHGYRVGIISRGYGGKMSDYPQLVRLNMHHASEVGDEALLLAKHTACPVVVDPNRVRGVAYLVQQYQCNLIISDDGLQHYYLRRTMEIAVVDGKLRYGNGLCLPAGPLREPKSRLRKVDFIVVRGKAQNPNEFSMRYAVKNLHQVKDASITRPLGDFCGLSVHAVAAIGNPRPFFDILLDNQCKIRPHIFPDHYLFSTQDFVFEEDLPIIMTEKDAVKCRRFADANFWYIPIEARLPTNFGNAVLRKLGHNH